MTPGKTTPFMEQYHRIKGQYPGCVLFFRMGDFYEMFYEDAELASRELDITLTSRGKDYGKDIPLAGIPYHALEPYLARMIRKGHKVAICEQMEDPKKAKGIVKRDVVRVVTPGTLVEDSFIARQGNNYLMALSGTKDTYGMALLDLSTGEFAATEMTGADRLISEIERFSPAEIIYPSGFDDDAVLMDRIRACFPGFSPGYPFSATSSSSSPSSATSSSSHPGSPSSAPSPSSSSPSPSSSSHPGSPLSSSHPTSFPSYSSFLPASPLPLTLYDSPSFGYWAALSLLKDHFRVIDLSGFGLDGKLAAISAAGGALAYAREVARRDLPHIQTLSSFITSDFMILDTTTVRNLELVSGILDSGRKGSLLWVLDRTVTPMGGRLLKKFLLQPLMDVSHIDERLDAVEELAGNGILREDIAAALKRVRDIERIISRISFGTGGARELAAFRESFRAVPDLKRLLGGTTSSLLGKTMDGMDPLPDLVEELGRAVIDAPPASIREGGFIRDGYDPALDEFRDAALNGKHWIASLEEKERKRTGIKSLRIRYNKVFGYYIEVSRANLSMVPEEYIRKQTTANAERYVTPGLKEMENTILSATERSTALESETFSRLRETVGRRVEPAQMTARSIGILDALLSLATVAVEHSYVRPRVTQGTLIDIRDGRHPVVERNPGVHFVPNDTLLDCTHRQILLITGPNMAGKSTYMRQVALIVLMAQIGSFVPAAKAEIGLVDRIFTRVGAFDDLNRGQSTFMVEMLQLANILNSASPRSLIVLDEIGRGTSTFDGLSIAWAVVDYIHDRSRIGARTLFATHYHQLTEQEHLLKRVKNYHISVLERKDDIVFLRKIEPGPADGSYGIQVAALAGLPGEVVEKSRAVLRMIEEENHITVDRLLPDRKQVQTVLFDGTVIEGGKAGRERTGGERTEGERAGGGEPPENLRLLAEELRKMDVMRITPIEALGRLYELKKLVEEKRTG